MNMVTLWKKGQGQEGLIRWDQKIVLGWCMHGLVPEAYWWFCSWYLGQQWHQLLSINSGESFMQQWICKDCHAIWSPIGGIPRDDCEPLSFSSRCVEYNGWIESPDRASSKFHHPVAIQRCDHYVTSVFCFAPESAIPVAYFNIQGCLHDSTVAEWCYLYDKMERIYTEFRLKSVIDSAFSSANIPFLIKLAQDFLTAGNDF